ncbi:Uncharacterized protein HZ326_7951 [Fusarium oxysporum f. sp. albedinis]|nr:Uncharacterized protein HZ326_7951 [Fusarium oxysporum f. sp. albedinis]
MTVKQNKYSDHWGNDMGEHGVWRNKKDKSAFGRGRAVRRRRADRRVLRGLRLASLLRMPRFKQKNGTDRFRGLETMTARMHTGVRLIGRLLFRPDITKYRTFAL